MLFKIFKKTKLTIKHCEKAYMLEEINTKIIIEYKTN